jgi:hypothetical protein
MKMSGFIESEDIGRSRLAARFAGCVLSVKLISCLKERREARRPTSS